MQMRIKPTTTVAASSTLDPDSRPEPETPGMASGQPVLGDEYGVHLSLANSLNIDGPMKGANKNGANAPY
jgi:hypothetical protein